MTAIWRALSHSLLGAGLLVGPLTAQATTPPTEPSPAQSPAAEPHPEGGSASTAEELFFDSVDVNIINVEVYVVDKQGNRIRGLTRDDFTLEVDGKPAAITNFYAVEDGEAKIAAPTPEYVPPTDPAAPAAPPAAPPSGVSPEVETPLEQKLHLIVYVDNFNLHPFSRNRAFGYIRTFLRTRLLPGDEVMLVSYDRSLHVRHPFTSDPELIASSLYDLEEVSAHAVHFDSDRKDILDYIYEADDLTLARGRASQYAGSLYNDVSFTIEALKGLVDNLAGLPGRKAILYISDGLAMRPAEDIYHALNDKFRDSSVLTEAYRFDATRNIQELTAKANANRVTFYALEAAGLRTYSYIDASNFQANGGPLIDQIHFANLQQSLQFMAQQTGGMAILNTNNFGPMLDRVADDFANYYSLGFSSSSTAGRYHEIEVKVQGNRDYKARIRDGYRSKTVETRVAEMTMASLQYGFQQNDLNIELEIGQERPDQGRHFLVPIIIKIPLDKLNLVAHNDMLRGRVRLFIGARDSEGGVAPIQDVPVPIDIPQKGFVSGQGAIYKYEVTLQMRRGRQVVAVGVRDEIGAVTSYVSRGLTVG